MREKRWMPWAVLVLLAVGARPVAAEEPEHDDLDARVNRAIDTGVAWLKKAQHTDGSWGPCMGSGTTYDGQSTNPVCYETGPTSFSIFTLARCGVPRTDKVIKKGLAWLRQQEEDGHRYTSYESSSIVLMLNALHPGEEALPPARKPGQRPRGSPLPVKAWRWLGDHMENLIGDESCRRPNGGWGYWPRTPQRDVSATQFALLALREAGRAGYPVPRDVWSDAADYVHGMQTATGAFRYVESEDWSAGMTAAALASLLIAQEQLTAEDAEPPPWMKDAIDKGRADLGEHFHPARNPAAGKDDAQWYHYCYLYAVERVGSLGRYHLLGSHPWYREGAGWLVAHQDGEGAWRDPTCMGPQDVLGTCFALLFLKRTTRPSAVVTPSED